MTTPRKRISYRKECPAESALGKPTPWQRNHRKWKRLGDAGKETTSGRVRPRGHDAAGLDDQELRPLGQQRIVWLPLAIKLKSWIVMVPCAGRAGGGRRRGATASPSQVARTAIRGARGGTERPRRERERSGPGRARRVPPFILETGRACAKLRISLKPPASYPEHAVCFLTPAW